MKKRTIKTAGELVPLVMAGMTTAFNAARERRLKALRKLHQRIREEGGAARE